MKREGIASSLENRRNNVNEGIIIKGTREAAFKPFYHWKFIIKHKGIRKHKKREGMRRKRDGEVIRAMAFAIIYKISPFLATIQPG
jgi:hypothetical protein